MLRCFLLLFSGTNHIPANKGKQLHTEINLKNWMAEIIHHFSCSLLYWSQVCRKQIYLSSSINMIPLHSTYEIADWYLHVIGIQFQTWLLLFNLLYHTSNPCLMNILINDIDILLILLGISMLKTQAFI